MKLSIVIPIYNEVATLRAIIDRVLAVPCPGLDKQLLLIDDASTDGTREILRELSESPPPAAEFRIVLQPVNSGKGAALRRGFPRPMAILC